MKFFKTIVLFHLQKSFYICNKTEPKNELYVNLDCCKTLKK